MEVIKKRYTSFIKALSTLEKSLEKLKGGNYSDYEELRDSIIQRFEYCCDIYWKFLKDLLKYRFNVTVEIARPKSVFRESRSTKLIDEDEYKVCIDLIEDRNLTSHGYNEDLAEEISQRIPSYYKLMSGVALRNKDIGS